MGNEHVVTLMNKYMEMKAGVVRLQVDKQKLIEEAMPKEVREKVAEIEEEFAGKVRRRRRTWRNWKRPSRSAS